MDQQPGLPPEPQQPPTPTPTPESTDPAYTFKVIVWSIISVILFIIAMGLTALPRYWHYRDHEKKHERPASSLTKPATLPSSLEDYQSNKDVNTVISSSNYFKMSFPAIICGPPDELYTRDVNSWAQQWVDCLEKSWAPVVANQANAEYSKLTGIKFYATPTDAKGCSEDIEEDVAGAYCRQSSSIAIIESGLSRNIDYDLAVIFHEFAHHLQMNFDVNTDALVLTGFVYLNNPKQPISEDEAIQLQKTRTEVNAECSTLGMMNTSKRLSSNSGTEWLRSYKNPDQRRIAAGYGSSTMLKKFTSGMTTPNPKMSACNTWSWADTTLRPE